MAETTIKATDLPCRNCLRDIAFYDECLQCRFSQPPPRCDNCLAGKKHCEPIPAKFRRGAAEQIGHLKRYWDNKNEDDSNGDDPNGLEAVHKQIQTWCLRMEDMIQASEGARTSGSGPFRGQPQSELHVQLEHLDEVRATRHAVEDMRSDMSALVKDFHRCSTSLDRIANVMEGREGSSNPASERLRSWKKVPGKAGLGESMSSGAASSSEGPADLHADTKMRSN